MYKQIEALISARLSIEECLEGDDQEGAIDLLEDLHRLIGALELSAIANGYHLTVGRSANK